MHAWCVCQFCYIVDYNRSCTTTLYVYNPAEREKEEARRGPLTNMAVVVRLSLFRQQQQLSSTAARAFKVATHATLLRVVRGGSFKPRKRSEEASNSPPAYIDGLYWFV